MKLKSLTYGLWIIASAVLFSCSEDDPENYKNQKVYNVEVNEVVKIYYTTNSCCDYYLDESNQLNHIENIGDEIVIPYPDDCDGCNRTKAILFKAKSKGSDTIRGIVRARCEDWSQPALQLEEFIINVQ
jgi:hypothetical protein